MIRKEDIQDIYGLSPMQKSILINHELDPLSTAYVEQFDFTLVGELEFQRMEQALVKVSEHYDILRTVFSYRKTDQPRQVVLKSWAPKLMMQDLRDAPDSEKAVMDFKAEDINQGFDLSGDVLLRGALLRTGDRSWRFVLTFHHIIMDGWSLAPFFQKLLEYYEKGNSLNYGKDREAYPYREYIQWLDSQDREAPRLFWTNYLAGYEKAVSLPTYGAPGPYDHAVHRFCLDQGLVHRIKELAQFRNTTVNTVFQVAWGLLLQKYNHTQDAVYGNVVSGRPPNLPGVESMVGLFINTLPLRVYTEKGDSFVSLCTKTQKGGFGAASFEYYPLYEIQSHSQLKNKLLNHVMAFENYPLAERLQALGREAEQGVRFESVQVFERTNYDFYIVINPGESFVITFAYNKGQYAKETMAGLEHSLVTLLEEACTYPDAPVNTLRMCSPMDQSLVVEEFNQTRMPYPMDSSVDRIFLDIASVYGERTALIWKDSLVTYRELDQWSDYLALQMRAKGLGTGMNAGLLLPRCPELIAGILGILKTGASYVPLDIATAPDRLAFMIEDADIQLVCSGEELISCLPESVEIILTDRPESYTSTERVDSSHGSGSPAYLMYTSGSTGQPKGCVITHRNILRLVFGPNYIKFNPQQVILQTGSPAFDASTFEIWGALLHGGIVVLAEEKDILDADCLGRIIAEKGVKSLWLTSALFNQLCDQGPGIFNPLENLLVGGDALSIQHIRRVKEANPDLCVVNGYGPTENTTFSTTHKVTEADLQSQRIPIGRPLANSTAYVLDESLNPLPVGAIGELCVGGDGVSLGYHKRSSLTAERFLEDPFRKGGRIYRTGDLARWLPDGTLDFLGRFDSQVKVRGYRVELGEIEHTMVKLLNLKEVVVKLQEVGNEKQLCAYYTADYKADSKGWRSILASQLPDYMIPVFFMQLDFMPLTINGKIDYQALQISPRKDIKDHPQSRPLSSLEKSVAKIFQSVLGLEAVSIHDNFFEIGANSLNLVTVKNRIKQAFKKDIPLTILFEYTSIARLAEYLKTDEEEEINTLHEDREEINDARKLVLIQQQLFRNLEDEND